jgi:hypothetical protein
MIKSKSVEKKQNNRGEAEEAKNNLLGFFISLLKIDMRINSQRHKTKLNAK